MKPVTITKTITEQTSDAIKLYLKDINKRDLIDFDKEQQLVKKAKEGDKKAKKQLVEANLRFVVSIAKQYQNRGVPLVDLIQEGNIALINCISKFDETKGFKLISYAVWWIRQAIAKAVLDQNRTIRLPLNQINNLNKINKAIEVFQKNNDRAASDAELSDLTNIPETKITSALSANTKILSLDTPLKVDGDSGNLLDIIPNNDKERDLDTVNRYNVINKVLSKLPYRNQDIIRMTFGIGMEPLNNTDIANRFGISTERVRQLLIETLTLLKGKSELRELL